MLRWFVSDLGVDGLFTDFPDMARAALDGQGAVNTNFRKDA
jgi:glycerophosphoryl diester phosphodiesterase